ncbi:MAG: DUF167 domain-containing protein [Dehalococcoidales bacterium]|nr:DUF167 domain-containing protein [Dehalococcoidales bacterium]
MENEAKISLRVCPGAPRNEVLGFTDGVLRVKVAAPPVKGKANRELLSFLSRLLGIKERDLAIIQGQTSRNKTVAVSGLSNQQVLDRLQDTC